MNDLYGVVGGIKCDVSGYKVVPAEVEGVIRKNTCVEDVVVIGEPDE